jgi:hypothetical protein
VLSVAWVAFAIVITGYARRQPVAGRYLLVIGFWAVIYAAVLIPGFIFFFAHNPAWWTWRPRRRSTSVPAGSVANEHSPPAQAG